MLETYLNMEHWCALGCNRNARVLTAHSLKISDAPCSLALLLVFIFPFHKLYFFHQHETPFPIVVICLSVCNHWEVHCVCHWMVPSHTRCGPFCLLTRSHVTSQTGCLVIITSRRWMLIGFIHANQCLYVSPNPKLSSNSDPTLISVVLYP